MPKGVRIYQLDRKWLVDAKGQNFGSPLPERSNTKRGTDGVQGVAVGSDESRLGNKPQRFAGGSGRKYDGMIGHGRFESDFHQL